MAQHALFNIFGFRALMMSRRLYSHNSKVRQTKHSRFAESYDKDINRTGAPGNGPIPGRLNDAIMCHQRVPSCSIIRSSIQIQVEGVFMVSLAESQKDL